MLHRISSRLSKAAGLAVLGLLLAACSTVPISDRRQWILIPVEQDTPLGLTAYEEILAGERVISSGQDVVMVNRVMDRLVAAVQGRGHDPGFEWEVQILDAPGTVNAFCLPGGKMAVYTGILAVAETEAGLAVVMGHEIAHAVARHGAERVSQQMGIQGLLGLIGAVSTDWGAVAQSGVPLLELAAFKPWGRNQELEADHLGLIYMADAGYDPEQSIEFWSRMAALSGGQEPPEFLSTHPSNQSRIDQLNEKMAEARDAYLASRGS